MTNERQAEANRQNAQKSTGPRTPAGKAVVALNGIKHGLLSRESLIKGESEAEFVDFGNRLRAKLAPGGELELLFADYQHLSFNPPLHSKKITITMK